MDGAQENDMLNNLPRFQDDWQHMYVCLTGLGTTITKYKQQTNTSAKYVLNNKSTAFISYII